MKTIPEIRLAMQPVTSEAEAAVDFGAGLS